jgi:quinol monooxygenase YgiN
VSPVVYEVNLQVQPAIATAFVEWLHGHVDEIVRLPGFVDARIARDRELAADGALRLCVHYRLQDAAALATYLREHAPRMRADGVQRFGDGFSASRRVLDVVADY